MKIIQTEIPEQLYKKALYLVKEGIDRGRILNIKYRNVNSYDFKSDQFHKDDELVVIGEREWGMDLKTLMKYFYLRYFWYG